MLLRCIEPFRRRATRARLTKGACPPISTVHDGLGKGQLWIKDGPLLSRARSRSKGPLPDHAADAADACGQSRSWGDLSHPPNGGSSAAARRHRTFIDVAKPIFGENSATRTALLDNWTWGLSLIALTIAIHATGVTFMVSVLHGFRVRLESRSLGSPHVISSRNGRGRTASLSASRPGRHALRRMIPSPCPLSPPTGTAASGQIPLHMVQFSCGEADHPA